MRKRNNHDQPQPSTRRRFLASAAAAAWTGASTAGGLFAQAAGDRPDQSRGVHVENPRCRVPVSFIIDDSTCLVNLAHFAIPQFHEVFPDRYKQDWKSLPREIPDSFVRKFAAWCHDHGVKGKYSVVPYPACVGWMDRDLPGWSKQSLDRSLALVRDELAGDWDFHPEMISHTWVINTKTGRPYPGRTQHFMENWRWTDGKSVDQLADYLSYALRILKNVGIPCEGITTPGGFGNRVLPALSRANLEACRAVFNAEIPHYFRHLYTDHRSVAPRVEYAAGLDTANPECSVSIIGCTGDWFGGWDGLTPGSVDRFITADLKQGRMVDVINRGEPAIMVCHWPGIYYNGEELGFNIFKEVVRRIHARFDHLIWMKLSAIARYWAARELTRIEKRENTVTFSAPFACPGFTITVNAGATAPPAFSKDGGRSTLREVKKRGQLASGTWFKQQDKLTACFDLPKGKSRLIL